MDDAHFVYGAFLGMVWCFVMMFIPSPLGRKYFNVLVVLNAVSKEIFTLTDEAYINAESICQLRLQVVQYYGSKPVTIVLDNARYQRCAFVQSFAADLRIEFLFLASYSPQLNLIERYWRFLRNKCLYSKFYPDFTQFKRAIQRCITFAPYVHGDELESWMA